MSVALSTLSAGSILHLNENGQDTQFKFLDYNHYGLSESLLIRLEAFPPRQFDSSYDGSYNNCYEGSRLDDFCNSVYPQMLDSVVKEAMVRVPLPIYAGSVSNGLLNTVTTKTIYRKGFALSRKEIEGTGADGTAVSHLSTASNRVASYKYSSSASVNMAYWTRTSALDSAGTSYEASQAYYVNSSGNIQNEKVFFSSDVGYRPAFALPGVTLVSSTGTSGHYQIDDMVNYGIQYQKVNDVWRRMV